MDSGEIVSASTDSTLRLWDPAAEAHTRTYRGHMNEKNFVGLSADGEFIACGSEQNEVRPPACSCLCDFVSHAPRPHARSSKPAHVV